MLALVEPLAGVVSAFLWPHSGQVNSESSRIDMAFAESIMNQMNDRFCAGCFCISVEAFDAG